MTTPTLEPLIESRLQEAKSLADDHPDEALRILNDILNTHYDDRAGEMALFMTGYLMMEADRKGLAYHLFRRCAELNPQIAEIWSNMGTCLEDYDPDGAIELFHKSLQLKPDNARAYANEGLIELTKGNPRKCIQLSQKALKLDPDMMAAKHNLGLSQLMLKDWRNGWKHWAESLGHVKARTSRDYGVPQWNGEKGTVLVYGEQGVGDELLYASCLPDLLRSNKVILECDRRNEKVFKQSFPEIEVCGTRYEDETVVEGEFEYSIAIGNLPYFFRRNGEYPKTSYLKPDPERQIQWRALFDTFPGRKIGLAWNAGLPDNGQQRRSLEFDDLSPILNDSDTFISLDYKGADDRLKCYPEVLKGRDIDELLPIISELDFVICPTTTVALLCGALGVPCYVLVPSVSTWMYGLDNEFPWFDLTLIRQGPKESWLDTVRRLEKQINPLKEAANA